MHAWVEVDGKVVGDNPNEAAAFKPITV
jgi:hypothetical protein